MSLLQMRRGARLLELDDQQARLRVRPARGRLLGSGAVLSVAAVLAVAAAVLVQRGSNFAAKAWALAVIWLILGVTYLVLGLTRKARPLTVDLRAATLQLDDAGGAAVSLSEVTFDYDVKVRSVGESEVHTAELRAHLPGQSAPLVLLDVANEEIDLAHNLVAGLQRAQHGRLDGAGGGMELLVDAFEAAPDAGLKQIGLIAVIILAPLAVLAIRR
jgi:hypothetical protein